MKHIFIILLIITSLDSYSQFINTSQLITIGDSVLQTAIGSKYLNYFKLDTISNYTYNRLLLKNRKRQIGENEKIKGKFESALLHYSIRYPNLREFSSTISITIEKDGYIYDSTEDVPEFILKNGDLEYISLLKVKEIGDSLLKEKGIRIEYKLHKDYETQTFIWEISNILRDMTSFGYADGLMELIKIEPVKGSVIEQRIVAFGHIF
jgi:hypothetical protein